LKMELKQCKQCGMPQRLVQPGRIPLQIEQDGVCVYCHDYNRHKEIYNIDYEKKRTRFEEMINQRKGKGKYDIAVMFTGGKDSCYSLYLLTKKYNLNVLAISWDNGFFGEGHRDNLERVPRQMGVDHKIVSLDKDVLSEFYKNRFHNFGRFCGCLTPGFLSLSPVLAEAGVSLVASGVSFGQTISKLQNTFLFGDSQGKDENVLRKLVDGFGFTSVSGEQFNLSLLIDFVIGNFSDKAIEYFTKCVEALNILHSRDAYLVNLPCIFDWDLKNVVEKAKELGWRKPANALDIGHTSCMVEEMKGYAACSQNILNNDMNELCAELRFGCLNRDEFSKKFETLGYADSIPQDILDCCLQRSDMTQEEFYSVVKESPFSKKDLPPINNDIVNRLPIRIPEKATLAEKMKNYYKTAVLG
ncbi:MAG TPA: hypothetical protein VHP38_17415, partial [Ruminiclostridium sp.]|nr:hypothetical protein [Ruminiclostridium sp.]